VLRIFFLFVSNFGFRASNFSFGASNLLLIAPCSLALAPWPFFLLICLPCETYVFSVSPGFRISIFGFRIFF
jgi:hypothetical protein